MNERLNKYTICFTGHRNLPPSKINEIQIQLESVLSELIENGFRFFGAGGALGFDTLAAQTVLNLKKKHPHIKLILVRPCQNQDKMWPQTDKKIYSDIKSKADKIVYTSNEYYSGCMQKRNRHLVNNSSVCVCYLNKQSGGTAYTVDYAKKNGLKIINISECTR